MPSFVSRKDWLAGGQFSNEFFLFGLTLSL
jgi:hypothetical protein